MATLATRFGELLRRLDHLLRLATEGAEEDTAAAVPAALRKAVPHVSPAVLIAALGPVRARAAEGLHTRAFFPKVGAARVQYRAREARRTPCSGGRAGCGPPAGGGAAPCGSPGPVAVALLEEDLAGLVAPFTTRTAFRALPILGCGSERPLPASRTVRLVLFWTLSTRPVDIDLPAAFSDVDWWHIGTCGFARLPFARGRPFTLAT
ncbi:hypothetical protein [Kineococcus sp. NUM-3379]